ncbi:hypothetical protein RUND412_008913 [Rhizina undulata]
MFGSRVKDSVVNVKDNHVYDSGNRNSYNTTVNASGNVDVTIFNEAKGHKRDLQSMRGIENNTQEMSKRLKLDERYEILTWLSEVDYEQHHKFISSARQDNTGEWLFEKPDFIAWDESPLLLEYN